MRMGPLTRKEGAALQKRATASLVHMQTMIWEYGHQSEE